MVLILSLLESKKNNDIVKRIMMALPIEALKKDMGKIFKRFKKMYKGEYTLESLNHVYIYAYININVWIFILFLVCW